MVRAFALFLALLQAFPLGAKPPQNIREQVHAISIGGKLTVRQTGGTEYHGRLKWAPFFVAALLTIVFFLVANDKS